MKEKTNLKKYIPFIILAFGAILRFLYTLYTDCQVRSHDLWYLSPEYPGKAGYILYIFENGSLPDSYALQFYQQPLFYVLGALVCRIVRMINPMADYQDLINGAKWISFVAGSLTLLALPKLSKIFEIEDENKPLFYSVVSFCPALIYSSGRISEEGLVLFFMTWAIVYTFEWQEQPSFKNTIILAIIYGLGMMTKVSMAVVALFSAYIMIKKVIDNKAEIGKYIAKFLLFGAISFPLGLWFNIRNLIKLGQPLGYVLPQALEGDLYKGRLSLFERFISPHISALFESPYANPFKEYSLPLYLVKSELFGEFTFELPVWISYVLVALNLLFSAYIVYVVSKKWYGKNGTQKERYLYLIYGGMILFAVLSYLKYPHGCTMDYRYYSLITIAKGMIAARLFEKNWEKILVGLLAAFEILFMIFVIVPG